MIPNLIPKRTIFHVDFNSYFATVEQQANPRLRGKPIGVTGGDRMERTVLGTASVEAKKRGVKGGMMIWQAKQICPDIIIVPGDSDKYLYCTTKFINILKNFSPYLEIFSIDESFIELKPSLDLIYDRDKLIIIANKIKSEIKNSLGIWMRCSIGISYNRLIAKFASSLKKPDGLVIIPDRQSAVQVLDQAELDDICGIGSRIKKRLYNLGVKDFKGLRQVPLSLLTSSFKSYGETLFNMAQGEDNSSLNLFYQKEEIKSIGHRHTLTHDLENLDEIKQNLLKISEMVGDRARTKRLMGKTVSFWYRAALNFSLGQANFEGGGGQISLGHYSFDGLEIFNCAWKLFHQFWQEENVRMLGVSLSNLKPEVSQSMPLLLEDQRKKTILKTLDGVNHKFGDFTLKRAVLIGSDNMRRKPNPYLSDRRFKF